MKELLYGISGLIVGAAAAGAIVWSVMDSKKPEVKQPAGHDISAIEGKSGDDFDKAYLDAMISHHQMALDMAQEAEMHAAHAELKAAASQVYQTQKKEIEQMQAWQVDWGYKKSSANNPASTHTHH